MFPSEARVGTIEASQPVFQTQQPSNEFVQSGPKLAVHSERPAATQAEHLERLLRGPKVYDLSNGNMTLPKAYAPPAAPVYAGPLDESLKEILKDLSLYPGSTLRQLADYRAARNGIPVQPATKSEVVTLRHSLAALIAMGLAITHYGANSHNYWLTESGLAAL